MNIKRKLGLIISHSRLFGFARKVNFALFQWDKRQQDKSFGSLNPGLKFYVIRSDTMDQGLMSMYFGNVRCVHRLIHDGFTPIVDWQNYMTQYNVDFPVNGTRNAWEYYFEQPCSYTLDEVYKSRNVRLSGWTFCSPPHHQSDEITNEMTEIMPVKRYVRDIAEEKVRSFGIDDMIGVLARGTDYTKLRPTGHPIAPSPEMICAKLDEFLMEYGKRRIFLATEDADIYAYFLERYGDGIFTTDNNLVSNYSGNDYVASSIKSEDKYKFGLDYLVKMLCLSRCKFLVAADTSGSKFARVMNNGSYSSEYVFNLGTY